MYKCDDCGAEFEKLAVSKEPHGEEWNVCPYCGSIDWSESRKCEVCGERTYNKHYCDDCMGNAKSLIRDNLEHMYPGHFRDLLDLLSYAIDEVYTEERSKEWSSEH